MASIETQREAVAVVSQTVSRFEKDLCDLLPINGGVATSENVGGDLHGELLDLVVQMDTLLRKVRRRGLDLDAPPGSEE